MTKSNKPGHEALKRAFDQRDDGKPAAWTYAMPNSARPTPSATRLESKADSRKDGPDFGTDPEIDLEPEANDEEEAVVVPKKTKSRRPNAIASIVGAAFDAAVPADVRRRLAHGQALAVIILVPKSEWVQATRAYFQKRFGNRWIDHARDGAQRSSHKSSVGSNEVAFQLSSGRCVVGISADVGILPEALVAAADITIKLAPPDKAVIGAAIARFTGRRSPALPYRIPSDLDLFTIAAAFRPGTGGTRIAQRLTAGAAVIHRGPTGDKLPDLEDAVEYGEARIFGLAMARDIADYRAGLVSRDMLPRGLIVHGFPGTGKSLFSHVLAKACGIPIVSTSVGDWFARDGRAHLDDVIREMRNAFKQAADAGDPAILEISEIDSIPNRSTLAGENAAYFMPLCNDFLNLLDNASGAHRAIVIGSTNNLAGIDPALLRPGRLEKAIEIVRPDLAGTLSILKFHVAGDVVESELADIASIAEGKTGAELMHLVREARRLARHADRPLSAQDLRAVLIPTPTASADADWRTCIHEAGHAVAVLALECDRLQGILVASTGDWAGRTTIEPVEDDHTTREKIEDRVIILLAGRSAERAVMAADTVGSGGDDPRSDIAQATSMIVALHANSAMGDTIAWLGTRREVMAALRTDLVLRAAVERDLQGLQGRADVLIKSQRAAVVAIARAVQDKRHLSGDAARALFAEHVAPLPNPL